MRRCGHWLRELVRAHYYFDPLGAALFDLNVILLVLLVVIAVLYLTG